MVVLAGAAYGVVTAAVDEVAGGLDQTTAARSAGMILNAGGAWAGVAVLSGRSQRRPGLSALAGALGLTAAVVAYYAFGLRWGDRVDVGLAGVTEVLRLWLTAALVVGAALGVVGGLTQRSGWVGLTAALVVPVGVVTEMLVLRRLGPDSWGADPTLAWTQSALVVVALLGAAAAVHLKLVRAGRGARP